MFLLEGPPEWFEPIPARRQAERFSTPQCEETHLEELLEGGCLVRYGSTVENHGN